MAVVECCVANLDESRRERLRRSDHEFRVRPCLQRCGRCYDEPFAVVDGTVQTGRDYERLVSSTEHKPDRDTAGATAGTEVPE